MVSEDSRTFTPSNHPDGDADAASPPTEDSTAEALAASPCSDGWANSLAKTLVADEVGANSLLIALGLTGGPVDRVDVERLLRTLTKRFDKRDPKGLAVWRLMYALDRIGRRQKVSAVAAALAIVHLPEARSIVSSEDLLAWYIECTERTWRPRRDIVAENVDPAGFYRGLLAVIFEPSDMDRGAELVASCLRLRPPRSLGSTREEAKVLATCFASAGFAHAAGRVLDFNKVSVRMKRTPGRAPRPPTADDRRILEIKRGHPELTAKEIAAEVSRSDVPVDAERVRRVIDADRKQRKRRRTN